MGMLSHTKRHIAADSNSIRKHKVNAVFSGKFRLKNWYEQGFLLGVGFIALKAVIMSRLKLAET